MIFAFVSSNTNKQQAITNNLSQKMSATMNAAENNYGYIYCMSNSGMRENTYKLGFTQNDPINRARQLYTEGVLEPFVIEFAKKVLFQKEKFQMIANILDEHDYRISNDRTFYRCEIDKIRILFTSIKGIWYIPNKNDEESVESYENIVDEHEDTEVDRMTIVEETSVITSDESNDDDTIDTADEPVVLDGLNRSMRNAFYDGQKIRHNIPGRSVWVGVYNKMINRILSNGEQYKSLNRFTVSHFRTAYPDRKENNNAWLESECEIDGVWVSAYNLPLLKK
jgi:hypothetical protein